MACADNGASAPAREVGLAKYVTVYAPADPCGNHFYECKKCHRKFKDWPARALVHLRKTGTGVKHCSCKYLQAEKAELQQLEDGQSARAEQKQLKRKRDEEFDLTSDNVDEAPTRPAVSTATAPSADAHRGAWRDVKLPLQPGTIDSTTAKQHAAAADEAMACLFLGVASLHGFCGAARIAMQCDASNGLLLRTYQPPGSEKNAYRFATQGKRMTAHC
jgi:hypothetical protein